MIQTPRLCAFVLLSLFASTPVLAAAQCGLQRIVSLPLQGASDRYTVPLIVNGKTLNFLVDTGGAYTMLTPRTVKELDLSTAQADGELINAKGEKSDRLARMKTFDIGPIHQEGGYFHVAPGKYDPPDTSPAEFDGIFAGDVMKQVDVDLDFAAKKLNLFSQDHCDGMVVYWQAAKVAVVPFTLNDSMHIQFPVTLDGVKLLAMLDTGAEATTLDLGTARSEFKLDLTGSDMEKIGTLHGASYDSDIYQRRFNSLALEGVTVSNPLLVLYPDMIGPKLDNTPQTGKLYRTPDTRPTLILGMSSLSKLHVYIAFKEHKLYITEASPGSAAAQ